MGLAIPLAAQAAEWVTGSVNSNGGPVYRQADNASELLGRYPAGMRVRVYSEARNGFYAIFFKEPWKGTQYVWIPADSVELSPSQAHKRGRQNHQSDDIPRGELENFVSGTGSFFLFNPSDLQSFLGDTSYSVMSLGFDLEYLHRFLERFAASFRAGYFLFSSPVVSANNPAINYNVSGFTFLLNASYFIILNRTFSVRVEAGAGMSMDTVGDTTSVAQISSFPFIGIPIVGSVTADYRISGDFYAMLRAGYQIHSLSSVPLYVPPSGATPQTTNVTLSAPFASLGVTFKF